MMIMYARGLETQTQQCTLNALGQMNTENHRKANNKQLFRIVIVTDIIQGITQLCMD